MKYFISQPMNGRTKEEIINEREAIKESILSEDKTAEFIDSYIEEEIENPLYLLGESIKRLSEADIVYFSKGWEKARGCKIEYECAKEYGLLTILEKRDCYKVEYPMF